MRRRASETATIQDPAPESDEEAPEVPRNKTTAHRTGARASRRTQAVEREPETGLNETPSFTSSIADAVVVKEQNVFFLTDPDGQVPLRPGHGLGLYYNDCRFLSGYELSVDGRRPTALAATAGRGFMAVFQLSGLDIRAADGARVPAEEIGIRWERVVDGAGRALHERLLLENFSGETVALPLAFAFRAGFDDVFAVRDLLTEPLGTPHAPAWIDGRLTFGYDGADGVRRGVTVAFSPPADATDGTVARVRLTLAPRERASILVTIALADSTGRRSPRPRVHRPPALHHLQRVQRRSSDAWMRGETRVRSDSLAVNRIMERSLRDLRILRSSIGGEEFFAAGVPWFATLFGRDSLITALQTLAYNPGIAEHTLRLLARHQGRTVDDWRDEEPGKILHELRDGEMARTGKVPHTPYYGSVDATPLFLVLLGRHAAWTGDLGLFKDLRVEVERALTWMATHGDLDGDGYLEYRRRSERGLDNQGWKDSWNGVVNADGTVATPPIALVEVQAYAYLAKVVLADLCARAGESARAGQLRREAKALRARFNRDFWLKDRKFYAMALQDRKRPAAVISSNPGHALWAGIAESGKARLTARRLLAPDMFSGWGIRTLSAKEPSYNPNGYHLGSVWPHDNALIVAGLRQYGLDEEARRVFMAMIEAAMDFEEYRLPELFAGFARGEYGIPVRYPVACRPQAWAAGSVPYMIENILGLVPEAFERRLRIVRPMLPDPSYYVEVRGLRVGRARADLRFERAGGGVAVRVLEIDGELDVIVEGADVRV